MWTARELARMLGGQVSGRNQALVPGPNHSRRDRSLAVWISPTSPDGFTCVSHAGDDWRTCRDYVRERLGLPVWSAGANLDPELAERREAARQRAEREEQADSRRRIRRAREVFDAGVSNLNGPVAMHLQRRGGLVLPEGVAGRVIRYVERCPWNEEDGSTAFVPAMVCAMRDSLTGEFRAIHRTRLTLDGVKVDRKMLGPSGGAVIMLDDLADLDAELTAAEGVETALAGGMMGLRPIWATASAGTMALLRVIPEISSITLCEERDETGASPRAVARCASRWASAGCAVSVVTPRTGNDLNDALKALGAISA